MFLSQCNTWYLSKQFKTEADNPMPRLVHQSDLGYESNLLWHSYWNWPTENIFPNPPPVLSTLSVIVIALWHRLCYRGDDLRRGRSGMQHDGLWPRKIPITLFVPPGDGELKELVHGPRDRGWGNLVDDPCRRSAEKPCHSTERVHDFEGVEQPRNRRLSLADSALFLRVQQRLTNVKWRRDVRCHSAGETTWHHVCQGVVLSVRIQPILTLFVGDKMEGLEWNVHH